MRKEKVTIPIWELGDYVQTTQGIGIVLFDQKPTSRRVKIQHKSGLSNNPQNESVWMDIDIPILISEEEFDASE